MARVGFASVLIAFLVAGLGAATSDNLVERLATCQDSWFDWKDDPVRMQKVVEALHSAFAQSPNGGSSVPRTAVQVAELPVVEAFPESVGMGVGFSVIVDASFDKARGSVEKATGNSFTQCETGHNMRTCGLEISEKRTLVLVAGDDEKSKQTLVGCY
jgi:hypothetical protein